MNPAELPALEFLGGTPSAPPNLATVLGQAYEPDSARWRARLGFAYATEAGLDLLLDVASRQSRWHSTEKAWIIGLHRAISQPSAIRRIRSLNNSRVRVFTGGPRLTLESLLRGQRYHAKVIGIDSGPRHVLSCLMASSANLTEAAFGSPPHNYEAGILLGSSALQASIATSFDHWWQTAWNDSKDISDELLEKYIKIRDEYLERNPDAFADQDRPSVQQIEAATSLWIGAGAMSGGSRNQVEFAEELARFFGPIVRGSRDLRVAIGGLIRDDRPLSHKITTFGVEIWRLSLPTQAQGAPIYPNRIIYFRKEQDAHGPLLRVNVADVNSDEHRRWRRQANRRGHVGSTSGNRAYGFY